MAPIRLTITLRQTLATALVSLIVSASILVLAFLGYHLRHAVKVDDDYWFWKGADCRLLEGKGVAGLQGITINSLSQRGSALLASPVSRVPLRNYPFFRYDSKGLWAGTKQTLVVTLSTGETFRMPLPWSGDGSGFVDVATALGSHNIVQRFAILFSGALREPVTITTAGFVPLTVNSLLSSVWAQWTAFEGWSASSVHVIVGGAGNAIVSPLIACAAWVGLALILQFLWTMILFPATRFLRSGSKARAALPPDGFVGTEWDVATLADNSTVEGELGNSTVNAVEHDGRSHRSRQNWDWQAAVTTVLAGWMILSVRWQLDLWRQAEETYHRYAGKTWEEKHLAADDGLLFRFVSQVKERLPKSSVRVFYVAGQSDWIGEYAKKRISYHLLPHNVSNELTDVPSVRRLRSGDYLLILSADPKGGQANLETEKLQWEQATGIGAELLYEEEVGRLYRVGAKRDKLPR